jgi:hypothetical protein
MFFEPALAVEVDAKHGFGGVPGNCWLTVIEFYREDTPNTRY